MLSHLTCLKTLTLALYLTSSSTVLAQSPFYDFAIIDVNNIRAATGLHGDLWHTWSGASASSGCEFPKGSGKHIAYAGSLWMAGYDNTQQLRGAATTFRSTGQEYWPGPLQSGDTSISYAESEKWARIWKIDHTDIQAFQGQTTHTTANTPTDILEWPAKGNMHANGRNGAPLSITDDMAPFTDVNSDGIYDPMQGDYPALKGDQMLWFVFSDGGPVPHNEITFAQSAGIEIKVVVYGYNNGTLLNNVLFYEYELRNTKQDLDSFRVGTFADMDMGYAHDDYIGFDSVRNMGFIYNGDPMDGTGQLTAYGDSIPLAGIRFLEFPGNTCSTKSALGSFMYFNIASTNIHQEAPTNIGEMYNYLKHTWRDSTPLRTWWNGSSGIFNDGYGGPGNPVKYVYSADPAKTGWTECTSLNPGGDRRTVMAAEPVPFTKGASIRLSFALVAADRAKNTSCPNITIAALKEVSDSAASAFCNPAALSVHGGELLPPDYRLYPNPTHRLLFVEGCSAAASAVSVYDTLGKRMDVAYQETGNTLSLDLSSLARGVYHLVIKEGIKSFSSTIVKE